jgi:hypothetical protein
MGRSHYAWCLIAALGFFASPAFADDDPYDDDDNKDDQTVTSPSGGTQGPSTADPTVKPDAPAPEIPNPAEDVRTYAGVGSNVAYAERGVGEFGGSMSLALSNGLFNVSADPSLGYFMFDNVELSGVVGVRHLAVEGETADQVSLMAEPSVHFPINDGLFWVGGVGVGAALADTSGSNFDAGLALAPRTGVQIMLGRSGLLNLGGRYSAVFSDVETPVGGPLDGEALLAFRNTFELQGGYTVMF